MTEGQLKKRYGWSPNSRMPAIYTHLVNADVDNAIFQHYGIETDDDKKAKEKLPKICKICKMVNVSNSKMCSQCGKPLSIEAAISAEEKEENEKEKLRKN